MAKILNHDEKKLEEVKAIITAKEIENQPKVWRKLYQALQQQQDDVKAFLSAVYKYDNLRVIFTGAGSSAFIGESMSLLLAKEAGLRSEVIHTTEIVATPEEVLFDIPTLLVSYSRSGSSPESVAAITTAEKYIKNLYNLVIVCNEDSELARIDKKVKNTYVLNIPQEASDQGFAMTCSVSCMALATWVFFAKQDLSVVESFADALEKEIPNIQELAHEIAQWDYQRLVYLGFGSLRGLAREGGVKSLELTNGEVSTLYDTPTGFRHGPKTVLNEKTLTVLMASSLKLASQYDADMIRELVEQSTGKLVVLAPKELKHNLSGVDYPYVYSLGNLKKYGIATYLFDLLFIQILSFEKSLNLKITTDNPCPDGSVNRVVQGVVIH